MKIHQILITENGKLPDINSLPEKTLLSIQSIKRLMKKIVIISYILEMNWKK